MILSSLADLANLLGSMNWYASAILASLLRPAPPQPGPFHSWSGEGIPGASEYSSRTEDLFAPLEWENISDHLWEISYKSCENLYTAYILGFSLQARYLPVVGCHFAIVKRRSDAEQSFCFCFQESPMLVCTAQQNARTLPLSWSVAEGFFVFWDSFQPVWH
jgi:hypothetical protein